MAASNGEGQGHGRFDVIVVGAGIMGSCAAYAASARGARVLLLERFDLLHHRGSSHGESRTIRATYPQAHYPPMVRLSRRLWDEAQADAGYAVPTPTPHLDLGPADDPALVAAIRDGGATEVAAGEPWPWAGVFRVPDGWTAAPSELGGVMKATKAVAMFQALAVKKGAVLRDKTEVVNVTKRGEGEGEGSVITVRTSSGEEFHGTKCIVTVGAWTSKLIKSVTDFHDTEPLALMEQLPPPTAIIRTEDRMKVHVAIGNYQLTALIDSGATNNYISPTAARRVGLHFDYSMGADVVVGNGDRVACRGLARDVAIRIGEEHFTVDCYAFPLNRHDMVLGVEYLRTLGGILWDFDNLSMEFWHHGKRVLWKGIPNRHSTHTDIPPTGRSNPGTKKRKPNTEPNLPGTSLSEAAGPSEPRPKRDKKPSSRVTGPTWVN